MQRYIATFHEKKFMRMNKKTLFVDWFQKHFNGNFISSLLIKKRNFRKLESVK